MMAREYTRTPEAERPGPEGERRQARGGGAAAAGAAQAKHSEDFAGGQMRQKDEMRPYQDRIATHLYEHDAAMAVLRPGGGKTVTALTAIEELIRDKVIRHALVIAPKRVARVVWPDEIDSWAHANSLRYAILDDAPLHREFLLQSSQIRQRDITL